MTSIQENKVLALFDFDETLTLKDTLPLMLKQIRPGPGYFWNLLLSLPAILAWKAGFISNQQAKEVLLARFIRGKTREELDAVAKEFAKRIMPRLWRPEARQALEKHLRSGHRVILVSASCEEWLRPCMAEFPQVEILCSRLETINGKFSGKLDGNNCHGPEKERRIREYCDLSKYTEIYAYGDSNGDREMLALATKPFYRSF